MTKFLLLTTNKNYQEKKEELKSIGVGTADTIMFSISLKMGKYGRDCTYPVIPVLCIQIRNEFGRLDLDPNS